jgi:hypothetical protein
MTVALVFSLVLQQLVVTPYPCTVGEPAVVRAEQPAGPGLVRPIAGMSITAELPDGTVRQLGATDIAGEVRFSPAVPGMLHIVAVRAGARWVAPLQVVPVAPRWLYALVCVPLGLVLLVRNLRRPATRAG